LSQFIRPQESLALFKSFNRYSLGGGDTECTYKQYCTGISNPYSINTDPDPSF
jgi:hypothetical protein